MYKFLRIILLGFIKTFFPFRVINGENAKIDGAVLIISNHLSNVDSFMVGACFKEKIFFLCKKEWFEKRFFAKLLGKLGAIPIDRENVDLNAFKESLKTLKNGDKLAVFPEGTRNKTGAELLPVKAGAALIAVKAKVDILPVFIKRKSKFLKKNEIYVGKRISLSDYYGKKIDKQTEEELKTLTANAILIAKQDYLEYLEQKKRNGNNNR
ncbi:MAG: 1-acyl-sn-glycerol-3-phosphate acyltransferase [Clostridia bacterium]|nr:1-acyl-sn-glycerol-3-phosphate acyltransferase [Clostridia bacterium]